MNIKATLTEGQRKTLFKVVADTQDGGSSHWPDVQITETGQAKKRSRLSMWDDDHLSKFLAHQIEQADEPYDVYNACQYAIDELNRAAFAASAYGDELEEQEVAR